MENLKNKKVFLTGGHAATTALSIVSEIQRRYKKNAPKIYWVGPRYAMEGTRVSTLASEILPEIGVEFVPIIAGRFLRKFSKWTVLSIIKLPIGFIHALIIILKKRPDLILSFGGYAAFPTVVVGYLMGIKVIIHDETYVYNSTNRLTSTFAKNICVSRKESFDYYEKRKTILTGNPMLKSISSVELKTEINKDVHIYITGGSSGSKSINNVVAEILPELLEDYFVTHQTGDLDYAKFKNIFDKLPKHLVKKYTIFPSISPLKVHKIFENSDIVISRAGANTVSEIIMTKRPAILIPLAIGKWSEQQHNADYAKKYGIAIVINQDKLSGKRLKAEIGYVIDNWKNIVSKVKSKKSPDKDADKKVVDVLEKYLI